MSRILQAAQSRPVVIEQPPNSASLAYLIAREAWRTPLVVVTSDEERAQSLVLDLQAFGQTSVEFFPGEEHTPFEEVSPDTKAGFQRASLRARFMAGDWPKVIVVPAQALLLRWMPDALFLSVSKQLRVGDECPRDDITALLVRCGYQNVNAVEDEGTFAIRGGIVDVFAPGARWVTRLDFFGDELASIRAIDPTTQAVVQKLETAFIHPIRDVVFDDATVSRAQSELRRLADQLDVPSRRMSALIEDVEQRNYFFGIETLTPLFYEAQSTVSSVLLSPSVTLFIDGRDSVEREMRECWQRAEKERQRSIDKHRLALSVEDHWVKSDEVWSQLLERSRIQTAELCDDVREQPLHFALSSWQTLEAELKLRRSDATRGEILDPVIERFRELIAADYRFYFTCSTRGHAERLGELLKGRRIDLPILAALPNVLQASNTRKNSTAIVVAGLSAGFVDEDERYAVLTDVEIFASARPKLAQRTKRAPAASLSTLRDLQEGDYVIHVDHGIGRYLGLERLILNGMDGDYVHLEYAGGDKLYVPVYRLNSLQRYRGEMASVRLDKLGSNRWEKTKARVKDAVLHIAHELLAIQAERTTRTGFRFNDPDDHFRAFEATFPFEETPDQSRAISDVLSDLTRGTPMDRLICGDVGFGKTEVAMRAAYLAVLNGYQVAMLVPTTVLAEQHRETFAERLQSEGVSVEVLSRFKNATETRQVIERTKNGQVDILIGTHRLLSADVAFKNLGLLVIDEEQRFGVKHKERIKQLRNLVHVLTMSATPIPRTLHMATVGVRDLSLITTPPANRMAIRTEVTRFDETVIQESIRRELHRGGQVFVVHNRVQSIEAMVTTIKTLVPEAKVAMAHGQMTADKLERIMVDFVHHQSNVLVCTAIIESGIDIPRANTMIVNRADTFGLSQLYQLRGRIGRGRDRAYAYLLLPRSDHVTREAVQRLALLKRFSELGAGYQIASHDLEMRGAGDLLGADQSGHIAAVGFELYTELLASAVEYVKGQGSRTEIEPDIKLPVSAVLPESYVPEPTHRLAYYQRMARATDDAEIFNVCTEIQDNYGAPPAELGYLAEVMVIRRRLKMLGATALSGAIVDGAVKIGVSFSPDAAVDRTDLVMKCQTEPERYRVLPSGTLAITVRSQSSDEIALLQSVRHEIGQLKVQKLRAR